MVDARLTAGRNRGAAGMLRAFITELQGLPPLRILAGDKQTVVANRILAAL